MISENCAHVLSDVHTDCQFQVISSSNHAVTRFKLCFLSDDLLELLQTKTGIAIKNESKAVKESKPDKDDQNAPENQTGTDMKQNTGAEMNPDHETDPQCIHTCTGVIEHAIDIQDDQLPAKKKLKMDMLDIAAESENVVFDEDGDLILERHVATFECPGNIQVLGETGGDSCESTKCIPGRSSMSSGCTCSCGYLRSRFNNSSDEHFKCIERSLCSVPVGVFCDNSISDCNISAEKKHLDKDTLNFSDVDIQGTNVSHVSVRGASQSECKFQETSSSGANINETCKSEGNIQGTSVPETNIKVTSVLENNIQGTSVPENNIQGKGVSETNIQGTSVPENNIQGTNVPDNNIQGTSVPEDTILATRCVTVYEDANKLVKDIIEPEVFYITIKHSLATGLDDVGEQVWLGALLLSDYMISHYQELENRTIIDLGAGVGLTSIVAAMYARVVFSTDTGENILAMAEHNIASSTICPTLPRLPGTIHVKELDWFKGLKVDASQDRYGLTEDDINCIYSCETLIAADVVYDFDITDAFFNSVIQIMSHPPSKTLYVGLEKRLVFTVEDLTVSSPAYNYFRLHLDDLITERSDPDLTYTVEQLDTDFTQYFQYNRIKQLEIWKITSVMKKA